MRVYSKLTFEAFEKGSGRKEKGSQIRVDFFYDVEKRVFILLEKGEHVENICKLFGITKDEIQEYSDAISNFVPVTLVFNYVYEEIILEELFVGVSGIELAYGIRHSREYLDKAHAAAMIFIENGEIPVSEKFEHKVNYRYAA